MSSEGFQLLEQNPQFSVVFKPEGISVHNEKPSLLELLNKLGIAPHFVNRLDRETSGLVLIAATPDLHLPLSSALEHGRKQYRALLRSPWKSEVSYGNWTWPISDKAEGYRNPQGKASDRLDSETLYRVSRSNKYFTEMELVLKSGRQHQIRKHAAIAQHPIVGDSRYNEEKYNKNIEKFYGNKRMLLQAEELKFDFNNKSFHFKMKLNLDAFFVEQKT